MSNTQLIGVGLFFQRLEYPLRQVDTSTQTMEKMTLAGFTTEVKRLEEKSTKDCLLIWHLHMPEPSSHALISQSIKPGLRYVQSTVIAQ